MTLPRKPRGCLGVLALAILLALSACTPAAAWLRDRLDSGDATLAYVEHGVQFDPAGAAAYGVHLTLRGTDLVLIDGPESCVVDETAAYLDCSLGTVLVRVTVHLSGRGVIGSATYTRAPNSLAWLWAYTPIE